MNPAPRLLAFVLAGGEGARLQPLTAGTCKPAVTFHGRYRLVDFVLSNLVNSQVSPIFLLVQHKPVALVEHVRSAWNVPGHRIATVLPRAGGPGFLGTADAVFRNIHLIRRLRPDIVAVFGADHVYRMDVRQMVDFHLRSNAHASIATVPVPVRECDQFGVVEIDADRRVHGFSEKPRVARAMPGSTTHALASMGNYLFDADVLLRQLERMHARGETDFGRHVLPSMLRTHRVAAYDFSRNTVPGTQPWEETAYWRDVGTLDAFHAAHFDSCGQRPKFELVNRRWGIPCRVDPGQADTGEAGDGTDRTILMERASVHPHSRVRNAIVGVDNTIPAGESIGFDPARDRQRFTVTPGGVVVVPPGYFARPRIGMRDRLRLLSPALGVRAEPVPVPVVPGTPSGADAGGAAARLRRALHADARTHVGRLAAPVGT